MIYLDFDHIRAYCDTGAQPLDFDIVTVVRGELLEACQPAHDANQQERICFEQWQIMLKDHDWQPSFQGRPQVIYFTDVAPNCHLTALQWYLQTQCMDIEQVHVVIPNHLNSRQWWGDWCHQARVTGFNLHDWTPGETFWMRRHDLQRQQPDWHQAWQQKLTTVHKTFSLFGGSYAALDRCYLVLCFSSPGFVEHGMIDLQGRTASLHPWTLQSCTGSRLPGKFAQRQALAAYCESLSNFKDFAHVQEINGIYDTMIQDGQYQSTFSRSQFVYELDISVNLDNTMAWRINQNCWFNVVRETMDDHCFAMCSEKTLRPFAHFSIPLPMGFNAARSLRDLGFQLYDDIIDYSYLEHHNYMYRVRAAKQQLAKYLGENLADYWRSHRNQFFHNAQLAWDMAQGNLGSRLQLS